MPQLYLWCVLALIEGGSDDLITYHCVCVCFHVQVGVYLSIPTFPWHIFNATLLFHSTHELGLLKYDKERNYLHMFFVVSYVFLWVCDECSIFSGGFFLFDFFRVSTSIEKEVCLSFMSIQSTLVIWLRMCLSTLWIGP
jgi:hypothetical protein